MVWTHIIFLPRGWCSYTKYKYERIKTPYGFFNDPFALFFFLTYWVDFDHGFSLGEKGFLDDQFAQLQQLQDESNPDFVFEVVTLFFDDSEKLLNDLGRALWAITLPSLSSFSSFIYFLCFVYGLSIDVIWKKKKWLFLSSWIFILLAKEISRL